MSTLIIYLITVYFFVSGKSEVFRAHSCVYSKNCHSHDFEVSHATHSHQNISLSFAVKLKNVDKIYEIVNDVSNPKSSNYGNYLSFEQLGELTFNSEAKSIILKHLLKFVRKSQISSTPYSGFIRVNTNVQTAQEILKTKFHQFKSIRSGEEITRTFEFNLPSDVAESIDYIFPTIQFPSTLVTFDFAHEKTIRDSNLLSLNVLNSFYNISSNQVTNSGVSQSIFATGGQSFSRTDLKTFQKYFHIPLHPIDHVLGKNQPTICISNPTNCMEASLDIQYITSVAQLAPTTFWSTTLSFSSWLEQIASTPNPPLVNSISYGALEEQTTTTEQQRFSQEAAKLGAQGITIVVASGDDGVANYGARNNPTSCGFHPSYPANIPYVLSVGATMGPEFGSQEVACQSDKSSAITSGGGFSTLFPQPQYQSSLVQQYLSKANSSSSSSLAIFPQQSMFNSSGRAFPDVAIAGNNYEIFVNRQAYVVSGTSASAPVFAAILSLVNNARLNSGKPSLGFVNPALYQLYSQDPTIFHDITSGDNRCAAQNTMGSSVCCEFGFTCESGWDPVTGLGSVNVGRLIEALLEL